MINTEKFLKLLLKKKIKFFCGVPDRSTNELCNELIRNKKKIENIVTANEGIGISIGLGYYLANKQIPCIYMQNSGLGNATDPLTNLCNQEVYKIPMILIIGWRGAPGIKDEPQHNIQGRILKRTLKSFQINHMEIKNNSDFPRIIKLINFAKINSRCVALIVKPKVFKKSKLKKIKFRKKSNILRKDVINSVLKNTKKNTKIVASVGYNSRELFQIRSEKNYKNGKDFLLVGAMGHTAAASLGLSKFVKTNVLCIDGDGSFIMHLGTLTIMNNYKLKNFKYILVDNESHESIGDQSINIKNININKLSQSLGFKKFYYTSNKNNLENLMKKFLKSNGPSFFHIKIQTGTLPNLVRPKNFSKIKEFFMKN